MPFLRKSLGLFLLLGWCGALSTYLLQTVIIFLQLDDFRLGKKLEFYRRGRQVVGSGGSFDFRTPLEIVSELNRAGDIARPLVTSHYFTEEGSEALAQLRVYPLGGISLKRTVYCNESGAYRIYQSDEFGFANAVARPEQPVEAVLLGDSFGLGACVPWGKGPAERLNQMGIVTRNYSFARNGPLSNLAALREYGLAHRPRFIFWLHYDGNDFTDVALEQNNPFLRRYVLDPGYSQQLASRQNEINQLIDGLLQSPGQYRFSSKPLAVGVRPRWRLSQIAKLVPLRNYLTQIKHPVFAIGTSAAIDSTRLEWFEKSLFRAKSAAASVDAKLVPVFLPSWISARDSYSELASERAFLETCSKLDLAAINFRIIARDQIAFRDLFALGRAGHFTPTGYDLLARSLAEIVKNKP